MIMTIITFLRAINLKYVAIAIALVATAYLSFYVNENKWEAITAERNLKEAELRAQIKDLELRSAKVTTEIVIEYVDRVKIVKQKGDNVIIKVPEYVTQASNDNCTIPLGFGLLHDAAAANTSIPQATGDPDAPAPAIELSDVAITVVDNYTRYHEVAEQLRALQAWVTAQDQIINK